ncbi:hypothetical protein [Trinickia symbiotica]|uniref:hypothetical protein n=1 Tax=Trinickia symbiotica TaxID=863227 RepID=UPI00037E3354|nr:hypothetical protein [Trinickia symbiotica]
MDAHLTSLSGIELQRTVLRELIERAKAGDVRSIAGEERVAGNAFPLPEAVRVVLADERVENVISRLVAVNAIRLKLDVNALAHACECIERQWWEEALLQYFVGAYASAAMIQALFRHVSRTRVERLRRELNVAPPTKPIALTDIQLAQVFDLWSELRKTVADERERYVELHERCGGRYTLATLFAALRVDEGARSITERRAINVIETLTECGVALPAKTGEGRSVTHECH